MKSNGAEFIGLIILISLGLFVFSWYSRGQEIVRLQNEISMASSTIARLNSSIAQGTSSDPEAGQRQTCYDDYSKLFKQAKDINDPLSYDVTNPELYNCLNKLSNPLGL
jgi:hypothetical protein